jgi:hypothetical protein
MFPCPLCVTTFDKRKDVDRHLDSVHADNKSPYGCTLCSACFSSEKAAKLHRKKHDVSLLNRDEQDPVERDSKRVRVAAVCPFVGTLSDWVHARYNPVRSTNAEQLSHTTIARIEAFAATLRFGQDDQTLHRILTMTDDDGLIIEYIDNFVDLELQSYALQTVNNHVRYLKILLLFQRDHIDPPSVDDVVIDYVVDLVADTQTTTTRASTTLNMLKREDPFALAMIRDTLVNALLREQVESIHPYIMTQVLQPSTVDPPVIHTEFGIRLRNWLELAIRFTNIPCRIQCSRELQMDDPTSSPYVCKLVLRDAQYCRLIAQDKTAASHQPLLIPLGRSLSVYLYFYLTYCRPKTDHTFVFCTRRGAKWSRPSRDLKQYMEHTLGIPVHEVDPTGRFIHGSRSIMMAVFAIGVNFDQQKMHGFARLMRHSSTTNERFYSMWQQRALSNQSIDVFSTVMELDFDSTTLAPTTYQPVRLREVPSHIRAAFMDGFGTHVSRSNVQPCYGTRSVGTQTGTDGNSPENTASTVGFHEIDVADTQPRCLSCGLFTLELYGPFGSLRRKRYVGRYYLACHTCHRTDEGRFNLQSCLWYPLGYVPTQKSNSSRPRNMTEIQNFIASSNSK